MSNNVKFCVLAPFLFNLTLQLLGKGFETRAGIGGFEFGDDAVVALFFELLFHRDETVAILENSVDENDAVVRLRLGRSRGAK